VRPYRRLYYRMDSKHDADLAGGAQADVFEYNGDEVVEPIQFPNYVKSEEDIDEDQTITAEQAFEVFAGKLFSVHPYKKQKASAVPVSTETPIERLTRIKRELQELQDESIFQEELEKLQGQFETLSAVQARRQQDLNGFIQSSIDRLAQETKVGDPAAAMAKPSSRSDESSRIAVVESAMAKLQERLPSLEAQLDVDGLQKKAKVIRQDLEAAAKARTKLQQHSGGGGASSEDTKRIAALYDQMQSLQGVSHCLPVLAERLETLAMSHSQAASHQVRVRAMEQTVGQLQGQMQSIEGTLAALEAAMKENAEALQASIRSLS
jgi:uncharacterized protein YceH (UPF0502 family)